MRWRQRPKSLGLATDLELKWPSRSSTMPALAEPHRDVELMAADGPI